MISLSNGLQVLLLKDSSLPYVHLELLVPIGSTSDPAGKEGLSSLMVDTLDRGTSTRSALQITQELEGLGTEFLAIAHKDFALFSVDVLSWNFSQVLEIFSDIISRPVFPEKEVAWVKKQSLSQIEKLPESSSAFAYRALSRILFQGSRYAHSTIGFKKSVQSIQQEDIRTHYKQHFLPQNARLGITGQYPKNIKKELEKYLSQWKMDKNFAKKQSPQPDTDKEAVKETPAGQEKTNPFYIVHRAGQFQSEIRAARPSLHRANPDYLAVQIANIVLGAGGLDSRLFVDVRGKRGLTYSIRSGLQALLSDGFISVKTPTRLEVTKEAATRILHVVDEFYKNGITQEELEKAKRHYRISLLRQSETAERRMSRRLFLNFYDLPYDIDRVDKDLKKLKMKDIDRVIKKYFNPDQFIFVVFSDFDKIRSQFKKASLKEVQNFQDFL